MPEFSQDQCKNQHPGERDRQMQRQNEEGLATGYWSMVLQVKVDVKDPDSR